MKTEKISESGLIGTDGKFRLPMDRLNQFFAEHKGERVVVKIEAYEQGSSKAQVGYYFNYILPTIQAAFFELGDRKSTKQVHEYLEQEYAKVTADWDEEIFVSRLSKAEFSKYLDWVKQFAAENLSVYVEDAKLI